MMRTMPLLILAVAGCGGGGSHRARQECAPAECDQRCAAKDAAACGRAAELYFDGKNGHPLDMARSYRFATQACDAGDPYGCMFVGRHHQDGLGADFDPAQAVAMYERACTANVGVACYNLSSMYVGGHGVEPDFARGEAYGKRATAAWQAACKGDQPRWCTNAAFALGGDGAPSAAIEREQLGLDRRACDAHVLVGCTELARLQQKLGTLTPAAYVAELERLCDAGEPSGCTLAGATLTTGKVVAADVARGLALLTRGCDHGDVLGCVSLGMELGLGERVAKDEVAAERYLAMACDRASGLACFTLADVHRRHDDWAGAVGFGKRACWMGHAEACFLVAIAYHGGHGVVASEAEAVSWSKMSCRGGFAPACGTLIERGVALPLPAELQTRIRAQLCADGQTAACPPR